MKIISHEFLYSKFTKDVERTFIDRGGSRNGGEWSGGPRSTTENSNNEDIDRGIWAHIAQRTEEEKLNVRLVQKRLWKMQIGSGMQMVPVFPAW